MREIEEIFYEYNQMLFRICLVMLCREADAQDVVQETFCRYLEGCKKKRIRRLFEDKEHEKAWLIRVAVNLCRDIQREEIRHPKADMKMLEDYYETQEDGEVLELLMGLPEKWKTVVYLYYVEGYRIKEIGEMLKLSETAVKKRLQRGRDSLQAELVKTDIDKVRKFSKLSGNVI